MNSMPVRYVSNLSSGIDIGKFIGEESHIIPRYEIIPQVYIDKASPEFALFLERAWSNDVVLKQLFFKTLDAYYSLPYTERLPIRYHSQNDVQFIVQAERGRFAQEMKTGYYFRAMQYITNQQPIEELRHLVEAAHKTPCDVDYRQDRRQDFQDFLDDINMFLSFREMTILDHELLGIGQKKPILGFYVSYLASSSAV